jgi:hypothetical protein
MLPMEGFGVVVPVLAAVPVCAPVEVPPVAGALVEAPVEVPVAAPPPDPAGAAAVVAPFAPEALWPLFPSVAQAASIGNASPAIASTFIVFVMSFLP